MRVLGGNNTDIESVAKSKKILLNSQHGEKAL